MSQDLGHKVQTVSHFIEYGRCLLGLHFAVGFDIFIHYLIGLKLGNYLLVQIFGVIRVYLFIVSLVLLYLGRFVRENHFLIELCLELLEFNLTVFKGTESDYLLFKCLYLFGLLVTALCKFRSEFIYLLVQSLYFRKSIGKIIKITHILFGALRLRQYPVDHGNVLENRAKHSRSESADIQLDKKR